MPSRCGTRHRKDCVHTNRLPVVWASARTTSQAIVAGAYRVCRAQTVVTEHDIRTAHSTSHCRYDTHYLSQGSTQYYSFIHTLIHTQPLLTRTFSCCSDWQARISTTATPIHVNTTPSVWISSVDTIAAAGARVLTPARTCVDVWMRVRATHSMPQHTRTHMYMYTPERGGVAGRAPKVK